MPCVVDARNTPLVMASKRILLVINYHSGVEE